MGIANAVKPAKRNQVLDEIVGKNHLQVRGLNAARLLEWRENQIETRAFPTHPIGVYSAEMGDDVLLAQ